MRVSDHRDVKDMASSRWSATSGGLVPSRFHSSELSDGMIQSVKLRASGADNFVEPTTLASHQQQLHTRSTIDRSTNRPRQYELQSTAATPSAQGSSSGGWTGRAPLSSRAALPGMDTFPSTTRRGGGDHSQVLPQMSRAGKRAFAGEYGSGQQYAQEAMSSPAPVGASGAGMTGDVVMPFSQLSHGKSAIAIASLPPLSLSSAMKSYENNKQRRLHSPLFSTPSSASGAMQSATRLGDSLPNDNTSVLSPSSSAATATALSAGGSKTKRVRVKTERRREQCRTNQARYRNKQRAYRLELEEVVVRLREDVSMLDARHRSLSYERRTSFSPWNVVVEYFRLFRHGAHVRFAAPGRSSTSTGLVDDKREALTGAGAKATTSAVDLFLQSPDGQDQLAFLQSVTVPEVYYGGGSEETQGIEALADQWVRCARCFDNFELQLDRIEKASGDLDTIVAASRMRVTVSEATLRYVFPHLLTRRSSQSYRSDGRLAQLAGGSEGLARRLFGQQLEFKCSIWFQCDRESSKVVRLRAQLDLVTPIMRTLGSLRDAARVLDGARMTSDGFLLVDED